MDDKKRDLIPVAAIALFLVIIIALCAVRLHQRRETRAEIAETESTQIWYSEEQAESAESETKDAADQTEETTGEKKQTAERGQQEDEALTEHPDSKLPAGKGKESQGAKQEGTHRTVSGNDPLSGAESANKTNEEMLLEMSGYWEQDNMDAVEDLAMLPWYMRMSSDISDANSFYYYIMASAAAQDSRTEPESPAMRITPITTASGRMANAKATASGCAFTFIMTMTPRRIARTASICMPENGKTICRTVKDRSITSWI